MYKIVDDLEVTHFWDLKDIKRLKFNYVKGEMKSAKVTLTNAVVVAVLFQDGSQEQLYFEYKKFDLFWDKFIKAWGVEFDTIQSVNIEVA